MVWKNVPKRVPGPGSWPEQKKLEVLQAYLVIGNLRLAAATCNVPEVTARMWKTTQWWKDTEDELRRGSKLQLSGRLSDLVQKAMSALEDRIQNGDFIYNPRTKEFVRRPISAEHANKITTQLIDRQLTVEKSAVDERVTDEGLEARLSKLRQEMIQFALNKSTKPPKDIIDVDILEHDDKDIRLGSIGESETSTEAIPNSTPDNHAGSSSSPFTSTGAPTDATI